MRFILAALLACATLLPAQTIPRPAPELSFNAGGRQIRLTDYKGKIVVVEILSTTCPHCQQSAALVSRLLTEYRPKGVEAIGVAINDKADVAEFIRTNKVTFPVGTGTREAAYRFLELSFMRPFYFPQLVFVDRNGTIRGQFGGTDIFLQMNEEKNVRDFLNKLLAEGGSKPTPAKPAKSRKKTS